jgi:hypothetical protein
MIVAFDSDRYLIGHEIKQFCKLSRECMFIIRNEYQESFLV